MMFDEKIVGVAIHPGIGVARVGNSDEYFIGPELPHAVPQAPGFYRDASGALKRQAARFRVYGYNARGEVVREITSDAKIEWSVRVANKKAAWYQFGVALDLPESVPVARRNAPSAMAKPSTPSPRGSSSPLRTTRPTSTR